MTYPKARNPIVVRPRACPLLAAVLLGSLLIGSPAPARSAAPETASGGVHLPETTRGILRAEADLAQRLARLDETLELGSFPDGSALWPARWAASIEARSDDAPAQHLLLHLAHALRRIGFEHALDIPPDEAPGLRPGIAAAPGRLRAERIAAAHELLDRIERKLALGSAVKTGASPLPHIAEIAASNDSCSAARVLTLDRTSGYTHDSTSDGTSSCQGPVDSPDVWYTFTAPEAASYTFSTVSFDPYYASWDTVLSLHSGCPVGGDSRELSCSDDAQGTLQSSLSWVLAEGETVWVRVAGYGGSEVSFELDASIDRTVRGTVTRDGTGEPLSGVTVEILQSSTDTLAEATTGADGTYTAHVSTHSTLWAQASATHSITELWDDHACELGPTCSFADAETFSTVASDVSGIDFALAPGAAISGRVTAADTGEVPSDEVTFGNIYIYVYDQDGNLLDSLRADEDGSYRALSLPAGSYHVAAEATGYSREVWDDIRCVGACDPTAGSSITLSNGDHADGIDFVLDRMGRIQGVVIDAWTGDPLSGVRVQAYDTDTGWSVSSDYSAQDGAYEIGYLDEGAYHVVASSYFTHVAEVYHDIPCEPSCDPTAGSPIQVSWNAPTTGIDFALTRKATISGRLADSLTGEPVDGHVQLYDASGFYEGGRYTGSPGPGEYIFEGLEAGTYYLKASAETHEGQIYENLPCDSPCSATSGTPVNVARSTQRTGIDFALERRGSISGKVVYATTGEPLGGIQVRLYQLDGTPSVYSSTGGDGSYTIANVPVGTYRVGTASPLHLDRMFDGVNCDSSCDRTVGTTVFVGTRQARAGYDFALRGLGTLSGVVEDASPGYPRATVYLLDPAGEIVASEYSYSDYSFEGVEPGTYYLLAREDEWDDDFQDELYDDVPCDPDCTLSEGEALHVSLESKLTGLDFHLGRCPVESREEIVSITITGYYKAAACDLVTAHDTTLAAGAELIVRTGRVLALGDGFVMEDGAKVQVIIEPGWSGADR